MNSFYLFGLDFNYTSTQGILPHMEKSTIIVHYSTI